jgi:hypothetical protein
MDGGGGTRNEAVCGAGGISRRGESCETLAQSLEGFYVVTAVRFRLRRANGPRQQSVTLRFSLAFSPTRRLLNCSRPPSLLEIFLSASALSPSLASTQPPKCPRLLGNNS